MPKRSATELPPGVSILRPFGSLVMVECSHDRGLARPRRGYLGVRCSYCGVIWGDGSLRTDPPPPVKRLVEGPVVEADQPTEVQATLW